MDQWADSVQGKCLGFSFALCLCVCIQSFWFFSCLIRSQMSMICIAGHRAQTNYHVVGLPQTPLSINLILSRIFRCLSVDIISCVLQPMPRNRWWLWAMWLAMFTFGTFKPTIQSIFHAKFYNIQTAPMSHEVFHSHEMARIWWFAAMMVPFGIINANQMFDALRIKLSSSRSKSLLGFDFHLSNIWDIWIEFWY